MFRTLSLIAVVAFAFAAPSTASAYWPYYGYGGFGNGWGFNQTTDYIPAPPYFAVHPPVYYSPHITARHYGASPYAWLPGMSPITYVPEQLPVRRVMAAVSRDSLMANATMIENPFVAGTKTAAVTESQPLKIDNPFVASVSR